MPNIDLGSAPIEDFDPFASDLDLEDDTTADVPVQPETKQEELAPKQTKTAAPAASGTDNVEPDNPIDSAINAAETKTAEKAQQSLYEKLPVFEYAGATEDISDASQTFEELRIAKAADFPELEDGKRVSWTVEYGKISKPVADPKGTSIAKMKTEIETSKEFLDALKKAKDKNPACKVKPKVTAQSKGVLTAYKGVFTCMADVDAVGKTISILPAKDGKVYEIRRTEMGTFITPTAGSDMLSDVRAGFIPALPRIPASLLMQVVAFFRYYTQHGADNEALLNIYWDKHKSEFVVDAPEQIVGKASVCSRISEEYTDERYVHYMDIHSHNSKRAFFSPIDDADEKATRVYVVIGRLNNYFPEIMVRISNGGKFLEIGPAEVIEYCNQPFPDKWKEKVSFRAPHADKTTPNDNAPWSVGGDAL